ncbi:M50 family metallopeptidase [Jiangella alkaliphila]|uniref:Peptidase M50B-like n=1 Tax=Jiangella alkaliphila TaxID=419479 RepID=A0A1H2LIY1_9ACTN|nr:M50 family metallopeptidase [Jiangella alkaliphila]SDU80774.1 Peptidase M50B-like [Jiangella alkaliphila]
MAESSGGVTDGVRDWFADVRVDETLATMPSSVVLGFALAGVVLAVYGPAWRLAGYPVTLVHELGHVVAALTAGFRLRGVTVRGDLSGATNFWSHSTPGTLWTMWWGYPAPAVLGWGLVWAATQGWARLALGVLVVCLALVFLLSRSWLTVAVVLTTGVAFGLVGWYGSEWLCTVVVYAFAWLLTVGAVRGLWAVVRTHTTGRGVQQSDAYLMGRRSAVPGGVWLLTFVLVIGACVWFNVASVVTALD